jgi:predicted PurR-regulated permease PerM
MAAFLAVWGLVVVGLIDNVAKPFLIKGDVEMGGAVVFFALIGGIAAFGMIGLVVGPLAVAIFLALLRMYRRDYMARSA